MNFPYLGIQAGALAENHVGLLLFGCWEAKAGHLYISHTTCTYYAIGSGFNAKVTEALHKNAAPTLHAQGCQLPMLTAASLLVLLSMQFGWPQHTTTAHHCCGYTFVLWRHSTRA